MDFRIDIDDAMLINLSRDAKKELGKQTTEYAYNLIQEATLIEEGSRSEGASSEITSNIIMQAVSVRKNRNYIEKKTSKSLKICKIISTISSAFTGFLFDPTGFQNSFGRLMLFIGCFALMCVLTAIEIIKEK